MTTTHNGKQRATSEFKRNRAKLLADDPPCHWCGIARATEADHLLESDAGGTNDITNLVPACKPCNARRGQAYRVRKERENNGVLDINTQSVRSVGRCRSPLIEFEPAGRYQNTRQSGHPDEPSPSWRPPMPHPFAFAPRDWLR